MVTSAPLLFLVSDTASSGNAGGSGLTGVSLQVGNNTANLRCTGPLNRLGAAVAQGLHQYKDKFDPEWEPRYLAAPGGAALPRILTALTVLIAGGLGGVFKK